MGHAEFLELVLSDEVTRRETTSAALRARTAGLDPDMCLENWDPTTKVIFDHQSGTNCARCGSSTPAITP